MEDEHTSCRVQDGLLAGSHKPLDSQGLKFLAHKFYLQDRLLHAERTKAWPDHSHVLDLKSGLGALEGWQRAAGPQPAVLSFPLAQAAQDWGQLTCLALCSCQDEIRKCGQCISCCPQFSSWFSALSFWQKLMRGWLLCHWQFSCFMDLTLELKSPET